MCAYNITNIPIDHVLVCVFHWGKRITVPFRIKWNAIVSTLFLLLRLKKRKGNLSRWSCSIRFIFLILSLSLKNSLYSIHFITYFCNGYWSQIMKWSLLINFILWTNIMYYVNLIRKIFAFLESSENVWNWSTKLGLF